MPFAFVYCKNNFPRWNCERNWGVNIPKELHLESYYDTGKSFHGDGIRFAVYSSDEDISEQFLSDFSTEPSEDVQNDVIKELSVLEVPFEEYPNFKHSCTVKTLEKYSNKLYLIYDYADNNLYVLQHFQ